MDDTVKALKAIEDKVDDFAKANSKIEEGLKASIEKTGADATEALKVAAEAAETIKGISNEIVEIKQSAVDNVLDGKASPKSLGELVTAAAGFEAYASGSAGKSFKFHASTVTGQEGSPPANSDTIAAPQRLNGIIGGSMRMLRVQDILPSGVVSGNLVEYTRETSFTNNAAETAEGAQKPESDIRFELVQAPVKTIATIMKASKQILDDAPQLQSFLDTRMRHAVEERMDKQLLVGDGTGQNIGGIMKSGNHTVFTPTAAENPLDSINRAIYKVHENDYAPTAVIMNPADWGAIERIKRGSGDAAYVIGNPSNPMGPNIWGLPVVLTNNMTAGSFVVAAFDVAYQVWNREGTTVEFFEQDEKNVQENLLTIRAEGRKALAIYRPASAFAGLLVAA